MSHAIAKRTDPWTSHAAAREVTESGARASLQARVVAAVEMYPGHTAGELAWFMCDDGARVDRVQVARRLSDALRDGLVRRGEAHVCRWSGRPACEWWPIEKQGALL